MWLGNERGHVADWTTQLWVKATGRITTLQSSPWLDGPTGNTTGIGLDFFDEFASKNRLVVRSGTGLIRDFSTLSGPAYRPEDIAPGVRDFYQQTANYQLDAWVGVVRRVQTLRTLAGRTVQPSFTVTQCPPLIAGHQSRSHEPYSRLE